MSYTLETFILKVSFIIYSIQQTLFFCVFIQLIKIIEAANTWKHFLCI